MTTVPEEAGTLWAVNIHGPDDLIAAPDYLSAVRMANAFNAWWLNLKTKQQHNDAIDARMWAIPTDWPGNDAQGHAVELSKPHPEYQWLRDTLSALEPSAARELALEEAVRKHLKWFERFICDQDELNSSTPRKVAQNAQDAAAELRAALSSPDHADAGKVEGDGKKWPMREIVAKAIAYHSVGDPHAKTIRGDQRWEWFLEEADKFISVFGYNLPALPSAPSEGAE